MVISFFTGKAEKNKNVLLISRETFLLKKSKPMVNKKGDIRIQQMTFMILFVFIFFVLAGLFFLSFQYRTFLNNAADLQKDLAISSLTSIVEMQELKFNGDCKGLCVDKDKLFVFSNNAQEYSEFLPVASITALKVYPKQSVVKCPATDCNLFEVYRRNQTNIKEYGTYVSVCEKVNVGGRVYEKCELWQLNVGVDLEKLEQLS